MKVLSDILLAIDDGNLYALMMLDLSAAFDTVDHEFCFGDWTFVRSEWNRAALV